MQNFHVTATGRSFFVCVLAILAVLNAPTVLAKSGDLDLSFGAGTGVVKTSSLTTFDWDTPNAAAQYPDGRILQAGQCNDSGSASNLPVFCVRRFAAEGSADTSFGSNGLLLPFSAYNFHYSGAFAITIAADSRALIFGTCRGPTRPLQPGFPSSLEFEQFACAIRLNDDGTVDTTFGTGGRLFFAIHKLAGISSAYSSANAMTLLADGRFVVAGGCSNSSSSLQPRFCISRHLQDGSFDTTFAGTGWKIVTFSGVSGQETTTSIASDTEGSTVVVGTCSASAGGAHAGCAYRLDQSGVLASSFGIGGQSTMTGMSVTAIARKPVDQISSSRKIVVFGYCNQPAPATGQFLCARRLDADLGTIDPLYGVNGTLAISTVATMNSLFGNRLATIYGAAQWHDESTVVIGVCAPDPPVANSNTVFCIAKIAADGAADSSFGSDGIAQLYGTEGGGNSLPNSINPDYSSKMLTASGRCYEPDDLGFCLARVLVQSNYFDLDANSTTQPDSDGMLYLRHLLGFSGASLATGALGAYADRTVGADIAAYLSTPNAAYPNCSASIVGAPDGPNAMLDGIVLMRAMLGLTGNAVTNGVNFPAGTTRTTWADIKAHLNTNCGMVLN